MKEATCLWAPPFLNPHPVLSTSPPRHLAASLDSQSHLHQHETHTLSHAKGRLTKSGLNPGSVYVLKVFREWAEKDKGTSPNSSVGSLNSHRRMTQETSQKGLTLPHQQCSRGVETPSCSTSEPNGEPAHGALREANQYVWNELNDFLSVSFCTRHCGKHVGSVCEENTETPLLGELPFCVCGGEGKGMSVLRRSINKISKLILSVTINTLEINRAGKGTRRAGGGAVAL